MKLTCICIVICIFLTISLPRNSMAGPAVNKDGWLTKAVESLPFGGCFTAPFHAMGRNGREAVRSVVSGLAGGLTLVAGLGPLGVAMHKLAPIGVGVVSGMVVDIPFTYVKSSSQRVSTSTSSASIGRNLGGDVQYMAIKSLVLVNRWGFSLSADPNGNIISGNRNRDRNGWEGWVIEYTGHGKQVYLSRNQDNGYRVLAIDDNGRVTTTTNRHMHGWEGFELTHRKDYGVFILQRVKHPRYYLACTNDGDIRTTMNLDLNGWEAWIPE